MFWLKSIDVIPDGRATTIVALGDSITDGTCSTLDAHDRWEDIVAQRLALQETTRRAVINEGIGGPFDYFSRVNQGGVWDYKNRLHNDAYEGFGNFNYGATAAAAGYPTGMILRMAGVAQMGGTAGQNVLAWVLSRLHGTPYRPIGYYPGLAQGQPPYSDDPEGQAMIRLGIDFFQSYTELNPLPPDPPSWAAYGP